MDSFMIRHNVQPVPESLRIEGVTTTMTPHPDDAEIAAQALLEKMVGCPVKAEDKTQSPKQGSPEYFRQLAERIKAAHAEEERKAKRFLAYCDEQLTNPRLSSDELSDILRNVYVYQACAEREGGELKSRWQHCLSVATLKELNIEF